jgi:hypothetical protein
MFLPFIKLKSKRPPYYPPLDKCRYGVFSVSQTIKGDIILHFIDGMMPTDATLYKVEPPLLGEYNHYELTYTFVEWLRVHPQGFEITIKGLKTFAVYPKGADPDMVPWVGEFEIPGL